MTNYQTPRVTFVGSDPKIPALRKAIIRIGDYDRMQPAFFHLDSKAWKRFAGLWQAHNRRTRVLMNKVRQRQILEQNRTSNERISP